MASGVGREAAAEPDRHTAGVDLNLFTSRLFGDKNGQFEAFFVWNSNPDPGASPTLGDTSARGFRFAFPNDPWSGHLSYRVFGEAYAPAMGGDNVGFNANRTYEYLDEAFEVSDGIAILPGDTRAGSSA